MKKILFSLAVIISFMGMTQNYNYQFSTFTANELRAALTPQFGANMNLIETAIGGLEYPTGSGNTVVYSNSFWYGGKKMNDSLEIGGTIYGSEYFSMGNGPLTVVSGSGNGILEDFGNAEIDSLESEEWAKVFQVNRQDIEIFKQWFACHQDPNCNANSYYPNYQIPQSIIDWPAHGDVTQNQPYYLAPFYDFNGDGAYNPNDGDFPCIKGDVFAWMILNDQSYADYNMNGMGIEFHISVYAYDKETTNPIDRTIFVEYDIINRSTDTILDFRFLQMMDMDIGYPYDDYIGSVKSEDAMFAYNGSDFDFGISGAVGYGYQIPTVAMKLLNEHAIAGAYIYSYFGIPGSSGFKGQLYNTLQGLFQHGDSIHFGGRGVPNTTGATSITTNFVYPHLSTTPFNWTERNTNGQGAINSPDDRRAHLVAGGVPFFPGTRLEYDFAFIVTPSVQNDVDSTINQMITNLPAIQQFYNDSIQGCTAALSGVLNTNVEAELSFEVYPNPFEDNLEITTQSKEEYAYTIVDANGRLVMNGKAQGNTLINLEFLEKGIYYLRLEGSNQRIQKIVKL